MNDSSRNVPNPAENERLLIQCVDTLEEAAIEYSELCRQVAETEADFKFEYNTALLGMGGTKMTEKLRLAAAHLAAEKEFRSWRMAQELQRGKNSYIESIEARLGALRTVAANYRGVGGSSR